MRQIEKLRGSEKPAVRSLSNGEKIDALDHLTDELGVIDEELNTQHESCQIMLTTVEQMRDRLRQIRIQTLAEPESFEPPSAGYHRAAAVSVVDADPDRGRIIINGNGAWELSRVARWPVSGTQSTLIRSARYEASRPR